MSSIGLGEGSICPASAWLSDDSRGRGERPTVADGFLSAGASMSGDLQERADHLRTLEAGWDSYGGKPIDPATLDRAVVFALLLAPEFPSYPPQLIPCSDGSVQVEWHSEGWDVELWVQRA